MLTHGSGQIYIKMIKIKDLNMINNSGTLKWKYIYILEKATKTGKYLSLFVIFFFFFAYTEQKEIEANQKKLYVFHI